MRMICIGEAFKVCSVRSQQSDACYFFLIFPDDGSGKWPYGGAIEAAKSMGATTVEKVRKAARCSQIGLEEDEAKVLKDGSMVVQTGVGSSIKGVVRECLVAECWGGGGG